MAQQLNGRENLMAIYRHEKPEYLPRLTDTAYAWLPGDWSSSAEPELDSWGVRWIPMPLAGQVVDEKYPHVIRDISRWREQLKLPDPYQHCDWKAEAQARCSHWSRETQMCALTLFEGHFERMHSLMGFEDALCAFYDEDAQDAIRALFSEITRYKLKCLNIAKEYFAPDIIIYHDDWGTDRSMFFNPGIWHDYIKDELKQIVDETHRLGMKFEMHSCGHIEEIVGPLVEEVGIDSIQTLQYPQNDIRKIKAAYGHKLVIHGGYDGQLLMKESASDEEMASSVQESIRVLAPGGNHIPYYYAFGPSPERGLRIFTREVERYEAEFGPC